MFLIGTGGLTLLSIVAFSLLNTRSLPLIIVGVLVLGFFLSTYEATMPDRCQQCSIRILDIEHCL